MERYGWIVTDAGENNCFPTKKNVNIVEVHHNFFQNLDDCVRSALFYDVSAENDKRRYLKILKTSDVVRHIHKLNNNNLYGYFYVRSKKESNVEKICLYSECSSLFDNMLACVTTQKCFEKLNAQDDAESRDYDEIKLAYFMLLQDDDFLLELHRSGDFKKISVK